MENEMKNLAALPFKFAMLIMLMLSLCSCGFVHRAFTKNKEHHTQQLDKKLDSTVQKKADSAHVVSSDSTGVKKQDDKKEDRVQIIFQDSTDHNLIEVKPDGTITASGKIKSITSHHTHLNQSSDSSHILKKDTAGKSTEQTTSVQSHEKIKTNSDQKSTVKEVKKWRMPWYGYLIGILLLLLLIYYLYRKYKPGILKWWSSINPWRKSS